MNGRSDIHTGRGCQLVSFPLGIYTHDILLPVHFFIRPGCHVSGVIGQSKCKRSQFTLQHIRKLICLFQLHAHPEHTGIFCPVIIYLSRLIKGTRFILSPQILHTQLRVFTRGWCCHRSPFRHIVCRVHKRLRNIISG